MCLLNLLVNPRECSLVLENAALGRNPDVNSRSGMNSVVKQNPLPFRKAQWKKCRSCCETVDSVLRIASRCTGRVLTGLTLP